MRSKILMIVFFPLLVSGQEIFQKELSYSNNLGISSMVSLPDHGYLACGSTSNSSLDSSQAIIVRFDSLMEVQWCKSYSMLAKDYFNHISALSDGNFIVGGTSRYEFSNFNGSTLFKIDDAGNVIWHKMYSKSYDDVSWGVYEQPGQSIVIIVRHGVSGQPAKILKTDNSGTLLNQYNLSTTNSPAGVLPDCVTSDGAGNYYLGGTAHNSNTGNYMYYIARITDSNVTWYQEYDLGRSSAYLFGISMLDDGNIAATGSLANDENPNIYSAGLMKIDAATGSTIWVKEIKQAEAFFVGGYAIFSLEDNKMMVLGRANTAAGVQGYAAKIDANGNIEWAREYGDGPYESMGYAMEVPGNRYLLFGRMALDADPYIVQTDINGVTPCLNSLLDFLTVDLTATLYSPVTVLNDPEVEEMSPALTTGNVTIGEDVICNGTIGVEKTGQSEGICIFPNPSTGAFSIELPEDKLLPCYVNIYNDSGKCIHSSRFEKHQKSIDPGLPSGLFLVEISNFKGEVVHQQKIVIR